MTKMTSRPVRSSTPAEASLQQTLMIYWTGTGESERVGGMSCRVLSVPVRIWGYAPLVTSKNCPGIDVVLSELSLASRTHLSSLQQRRVSDQAIDTIQRPLPGDDALVGASFSPSNRDLEAAAN
jgi:hypothetical protein